MATNPDRFYKLLPVIHRQRDAEQGWQLQALLRVITEQVQVVEDDISQLYENWFIETCQDWVVPYIGDLIGYQVVHEAGEPSDVLTTEEQLRHKILIPRRDVANTIRARRRKGTLSLLEQLALDVAGWPARAVEFYRLSGWTQPVGRGKSTLLRYLIRGRTVDLRDGDALDRIDGPFDEIAHTIDVRSILSHRTRGRYNIPTVGLFVWRLKVYSVTKTQARQLEGVGDELFTFSILGNDSQLSTKAQPKAEGQLITHELNFPTPIRRRNFEESLEQQTNREREEHHQNDYYGAEKSLFLWEGSYQKAPSSEPSQQTDGPDSLHHRPKRHPTRTITWKPVDVSRIVATDLTDWKYRPTGNKIAVDPVLGRIAFAPNREPEGGVRVLYHYAFSDDLGGGEYHRPLFQPEKYQHFQISKSGAIRSLSEALRLWADWKNKNPLDPKDPEKNLRHVVIEFMESGVSVEKEQLDIELDPQERLQIRAANRTRPVLRLLDLSVGRSDALRVTGATGAHFTLDGLLLFGRGISITGEFTSVKLRHCTLVPGWDLEQDCEPKNAHEPSLLLEQKNARVTIEHSILGPIIVHGNAAQEDPIPITISDSVLDATESERTALSAEEDARALARLTIQRCTVVGAILTHSIALAENCIFTSIVRVARSQYGCVRFCHVPDGSRTPQRYHCQPDLVKQAIKDNPAIAPEEVPTETQREIERVKPLFTSLRYGNATYCQLAMNCAEEIKRGADDESELGVFHNLFQPQRAANLRARLDEFTPAGMEAGIIYVN
jgi:hypothetical protein